MADKAMAFTSFNGNGGRDAAGDDQGHPQDAQRSGRHLHRLRRAAAAGAPAAVAATRTRGKDGKYRVEVNRAIYGAVNGGGPEIELRTFNGSVYLRKGRTCAPPRRAARDAAVPLLAYHGAVGDPGHEHIEDAAGRRRLAVLAQPWRAAARRRHRAPRRRRA